MVAVNVDPLSTLDEWAAYWHSKGGGDVTWAGTGDGAIVRKFGVQFLGTTIIIDRAGRISYRDGGATPYETLKGQITQTL